MLFFSLTFIGIAASAPVCFTFPIEIDVIKKERSNGWYSVGTYFLAKIVAEFPFTISFALIYGVLAYYLTSQIDDYWRLTMFNVVLVTLALCCQSMGTLVSSFYANKIVAASFMTAIYNIPLFLFAGMFVRISTMASFIQPLTLLSYFRLAFESLLIIIYGFDRCPPPEQVSLTLINERFASNGYDFVALTNCLDELDVDIMINASAILNDINRVNADKTGSLILKGFDLKESDLYFDLVLLFLYSLLMQLGAYFVLLWKFNKKK